MRKLWRRQDWHFPHCSDKIILGAQGDAKKVLIIPWYNWNILPEEDPECNEIIQRAAFPRLVIFSFRILCSLRSFNAEQNNSEELLFWKTWPDLVKIIPVYNSKIFTSFINYYPFHTYYQFTLTNTLQSCNLQLKCTSSSCFPWFFQK